MNIPRMVLYDFTLCSRPQFAHLGMEVHGGCLTDPFANEFAFSSMVRDMFARCYNVDNKLEKNNLYFEDYPHFIYALMERYAFHIRPGIVIMGERGVVQLHNRPPKNDARHIREKCRNAPRHSTETSRILLQS